MNLLKRTTDEKLARMLLLLSGLVTILLFIRKHILL